MSGFDDDFVAALEAGRDKPLVTNNTREFERVTGLRLENWAG